MIEDRDALKESYQQVKDMLFFKQVLTTLEVGQRMALMDVVIAEDKEKSWSAACEYRGVSKAADAVKRLIGSMENTEGQSDGTRSNTTY